MSLVREGEQKQMRATLDSMFGNIGEDIKELNLIIKADVQGSIELRHVLGTIKVQGLEINIVRASVGGITESDVSLASASNAIIIGFNVRPTGNVREVSEQEQVEIRLYIYRG